MNRRAVLKLAGVVPVAGSAGCTQLLPSWKRYRLWFVRIGNGSLSEQHVEVRVLRDGVKLFEQQYDIVSFREDNGTKATYAAMQNARLIKDEWETRLGTYSIEYRLSKRGSFERVAVGKVDKFDAQNVGVEMELMGDSHADTAATFKVLQFDSEKQVSEFLRTVDNESAT